MLAHAKILVKQKITIMDRAGSNALCHISGMKNRIAELRNKKELSQMALAEKVGTSDAQINRLENGKRKLTQQWMEKIAKALECSPTDLLPYDRTLDPVLLEFLASPMAEDIDPKAIEYLKTNPPTFYGGKPTINTYYILATKVYPSLKK